MRTYFLNHFVLFHLFCLLCFGICIGPVRAAEGCFFDNPDVRWNLTNTEPNPLFKYPFQLKISCDSSETQWRLSAQPLALSMNSERVYAVVYDGETSVSDTQPIQGKGSRQLNLTLYLGQAEGLEAAKAGKQYLRPVQRSASVSFNLGLKLDW